jgi:hypothetical protein
VDALLPSADRLHAERSLSVRAPMPEAVAPPRHCLGRPQRGRTPYCLRPASDTRPLALPDGLVAAQEAVNTVVLDRIGTSERFATFAALVDLWVRTASPDDFDALPEPARAAASCQGRPASHGTKAQLPRAEERRRGRCGLPRVGVGCARVGSRTGRRPKGSLLTVARLRNRRAAFWTCCGKRAGQSVFQFYSGAIPILSLY